MIWIYEVFFEGDGERRWEDAGAHLRKVLVRQTTN